ncbi:MAG TPA: hypothetical protein VMN60_08250 [Longimicrobiales bacterium]|nr:hypothetical protein [Longimicrobiales bacterium]
MMRRHLLIALTLAVAGAAPVAAQAWDAPSFMSPRPGEDIGLYVLKSEVEGSDVGFSGIWRQSGNLNLGVRAGIIGSDFYLVGAELYGPLNLLGPESGLMLSWVTGIGAGFNGVTTLRVPLGVSVGVNLGAGGLAITPYAHPRVALDVIAREIAGEEETDTEINFDIDLGADVALGQSFVLRVGATIGDTNTFGAGIAYRLSRRIEVR